MQELKQTMQVLVSSSSSHSHIYMMIFSVRGGKLSLQAVQELLLLRASVVNGENNFPRFLNFETVEKHWFL